MNKKTDQMRIDPEQRLSAIFDETSLKKYPIAPKNIVQDNCAEEHIM